MIDRFWYNFFAKMDDICKWIANYFNKKRKKMNRKTNTLLIGLLGTILMGLATWTLVTLVELQLTVTMIQTDLMSIDKQFGRVYNFIDSVRSK
jgi:DNA polymerase III delta subunit